MPDQDHGRYPLDPVSSWRAKRAGLSALEVIQYQEAGIASVRLMARAKTAGLGPAEASGWSRVFAGQTRDIEGTLGVIVEIMEKYTLTYRDVLDYRDKAMPLEVQSATLDSLDALKKHGVTPLEISCYMAVRVMSVQAMWSLAQSGVRGQDAVGFWLSGVQDVPSMQAITRSGVTGVDWYFYLKAGRRPEEMRIWKLQGVDGKLAYACRELLYRDDFWFASALAACGMTGDLLYEYMTHSAHFGNVSHWLQYRSGNAGPGMSQDLAAVIHVAVQRQHANTPSYDVHEYPPQDLPRERQSPGSRPVLAAVGSRLNRSPGGHVNVESGWPRPRQA